MADFKHQLDKWVEQGISQGASDLHLVTGMQPVIRVSGRLTPLLSEAPLTDAAMRSIMTVLLPQEDAQHFFEIKEFDFSWSTSGGARFRGNSYFQRGSIGVALRFAVC